VVIRQFGGSKLFSDGASSSHSVSTKLNHIGSTDNA
jgi:hypothetical protein